VIALVKTWFTNKTLFTNTYFEIFDLSLYLIDVFHCFLNLLYDYILNVLQHKLRGNQKEKVRQFMGFTQANEKTAIACLTQHDWRLDIASDRFFQNAELYFRDSQPRPVPVDWKKIEQLFIQYRG